MGVDDRRQPRHGARREHGCAADGVSQRRRAGGGGDLRRGGRGVRAGHASMPSTRAEGIGSASCSAAVVVKARGHGCRRLWLITTNDNLRALGFYQRRGLTLVAVHAGALDRRVAPAEAGHPPDRRPRDPAARRARTRADAVKSPPAGQWLPSGLGGKLASAGVRQPTCNVVLVGNPEANGSCAVPRLIHAGPTFSTWTEEPHGCARNH